MTNATLKVPSFLDSDCWNSDYGEVRRSIDDRIRAAVQGPPASGRGCTSSSSTGSYSSSPRRVCLICTPWSHRVLVRNQPHPTCSYRSESQKGSEHIHVDARAHTRTHARIRTHAFARTHAHARIHTHTHACTHAFTRTHTCTHTCTHAFTRTHAHARTHSHAHTHSHARTHTHALTHTHARMLQRRAT